MSTAASALASAAASAAPKTKGLWRPPQWQKTPQILITVPASYTAGTPASATNPAALALSTGALAVSTAVATATSYVFDAVLSAEHDQALTKTNHPVQTGASVSSHAYIQPAQVVMYVLMSDVAGSFSGGVNQTVSPFVQAWTGNPSKSVSAYQQMLTLQAARIPLTVVTRLRTYANMLITKISPREDDKTVTGARFRVEFEQLFIATTQATPVSVRPNDTQATGLGAVNTQPPTAAVQSQFGTHAYGPGLSGSGSDIPFPPDLHDGSTPMIDNGVPGYLSGDGVPTASGHPEFTPQYPNTVPVVNVPGAATESAGYSSVPQQQSLPQ